MKNYTVFFSFVYLGHADPSRPRSPPPRASELVLFQFLLTKLIEPFGYEKEHPARETMRDIEHVKRKIRTA